MEKHNLLIERLLLELQEKMVKKIRGGKNKSFKCESLKDLNSAIMKIKGDDSRVDLAMVIDIEKNVIYIVDRTTFHLSLSDTWSFPYDEKSKRYLFCTGNYGERGFNVNELSMNPQQKKALKDADSSWVKRIIRFKL